VYIWYEFRLTSLIKAQQKQMVFWWKWLESVQSTRKATLVYAYIIQSRQA